MAKFDGRGMIQHNTKARNFFFEKKAKNF